ncbi:hypothetical protein N9I01_00135, partial [bacterium]|nr:hypothetical protein [bacterium]
MFDVFYIGENQQVKDNLPFAKQVESSASIISNTKMYWLVEPNIELKDFDVLDYRPSVHDQNYEHVWKWDNANYGGLRLLPVEENNGIKEVNKVVCKKKFDILNTKTPSKYFDKHPYATHVWCVDKEYKLSDDIDWAPSNFEPNFIHSFHLRGQLEHKYPSEEGGIKLYPKNWKTAKTKFHGFLGASATYPVMVVKDVEDYSQRNTFKHEYVWLIDAQHKIDHKTLDWVPSPFEADMVHVFRMPYQLQEKYPQAMGGIRLVPKNHKKAETKIHPACPIEDENYDVFYVDDDDFNADTYNDLAERSRTEWFWVVDREFQFNGKLLYVPALHEREYIHVFKVPGHLDERYPADYTDAWDNRCGGIRLVNKNFDMTKHKYQASIVPVRFDVFYTQDTSNFDACIKKSRTKMCWVVDAEHTISDVFKYVPNKDEQKYLLNFKIEDQLQHKYPEQEGGVYLIPKTYNENTSTKYKGSMQQRKKEYPILFVDDVTDYSIVTQDCWLIDKEYQIDDDIDWSPSSFEIKNVHTFHVPNQLKHKYPEEMGGVRWVPVERNDDVVIHADIPVKPKRYPMHFVQNPNDYSQAKGECWLIDKEYQIDDDIEWLPSNFEKSFIHTFHVDGQLDHKYPEEMGGVRWVPLNWENAETKIHSESPFTKTVFERYSTEQEGRENTTKDWFWVIQHDVDVLEEFDFNYVPTVWDKGKKHVWQKLNPKTGRQYDYSGVSLCPKVPNAKGRPKFIREPACTQREYPVYTLEASDYNETLDAAYRRLCAATDADMFWVVDLHTQLAPDFNFDYYPTQYDTGYMHVFLNEDGEHKNVRLVPKVLFDEWEYTDDQILNNSLGNLKLMTVEASLRPKWPIIRLDRYNRDDFIDELESYRDGYETGEPVPFVWSVNPHTDIDVQGTPTKLGFSPKVSDINKIHCWQKVNDLTAQTHGYGGLRLWPTNGDYSKLTTADLQLNKIKNVQYVREQGSITEMFDIVFLSYNEPNAQERFEKLQERLDKLTTVSKRKPNLIWVKDIDGIFNAHQHASNQVTSNMFWVVDGDADVLDTFDFSYMPDVYDEEVVHVWNSMNLINGLEYGYGGVKLFPTQMVRDATSWGLDFTTGLSSRFKAIPELSCYTRFNTDAYSAWRSAFRECVKLSLNDDTESK